MEKDLEQKLCDCRNNGHLENDECVALWVAIQVAARLMDGRVRSHYGRHYCDCILALADKTDLASPLQDNKW